jgi:hypothetical protein
MESEITDKSRDGDGPDNITLDRCIYPFYVPKSICRFNENEK